MAAAPSIICDSCAFCLIAALLFASTPKTHPSHIGSVDPHCNVVTIIQGKCMEDQGLLFTKNLVFGFIGRIITPKM